MLRFWVLPGCLSREISLSDFFPSRFVYQFFCLGLGLLLLPPVQALPEHAVDSLMDEGARMRVLMLRMQTQLSQPSFAKDSISESLGQNSAVNIGLAERSPWTPRSAILERSLQARWFRAIEQGVLGRFAESADGPDMESQASVVVGFVHDEETPWYGSLRVRGYGESSSLTDSAEAEVRLMVAPRLEDGSFLHVGLSFQSFSYWGEILNVDTLADEEIVSRRFKQHLAVDFGYSQESYEIQAQYLKSKSRTKTLPFRNRARAHTDRFHIRGAWRITGEQTQSRYAPSLLAHIEPRDEEDIWELVVRYANLYDAAESGAGASDSMLLGIHWRVDSALALELDYVEGNGEDFQVMSNGGLTLRGSLAF